MAVNILIMANANKTKIDVITRQHEYMYSRKLMPRDRVYDWFY